MTTQPQPEALRLADAMEQRVIPRWVHATGETPRQSGFAADAECQAAAAELRRLHAECEALSSRCDRLDADLDDCRDKRDALHAECEAVKKELETERVRLAACGVIAMSNTPESAARARHMLPMYRSASADDVANAVDREMALRGECEALRADRDSWERQCSDRVDDAVEFLRQRDEARAECEALRATQSDTLLRLLCDLRFALGDNGARMQPELVEYARGMRADAERYRWLRENRHVLLLTGFFGNGCVNREIDEVDAAIDAARAAKEQA